MGSPQSMHWNLRSSSVRYFDGTFSVQVSRILCLELELKCGWQEFYLQLGKKVVCPLQKQKRILISVNLYQILEAK